MSKRGTIPALKDILEAVGRIERYVGAMSESEFLENTEKQDAVVRNLEIIGEAARNLPAEFKQRHSHVQWAPIAGMRDRLMGIKVLLPSVANDPDRLARFSREAQALASLNHPNIAHIYGVEEAKGVTGSASNNYG